MSSIDGQYLAPIDLISPEYMGDFLRFFLIISCVLAFVCVMKQDICGMCISLLINENGVGFLSGSCSSKLLKFMDFLSIRGGVPVFNLPIENFKDSIFLAKLIDGLSPILPA